MSVHERQLTVKNLPPGLTQNRLKIIFQNHRNQGGGLVANIELFEDTHSAIITFEDQTAVQTILGRGNHVDIKDTRCYVYPGVAVKPGSRATASAVNANVNYNPPTQNIPKPQPRLSLSAEHDQSSGKRQFKAQENPGVGAKDSSSFKGKTIQMQIYNPGAHCDEYKFFLEDDTVNKGTFAKDYVYMDGLKKVVYVPFDRPEDARKMCDHKCDEEPNIYKILMAEDGVFDHYANILSIHGADFSTVGTPRLKTIIQGRTKKTPAKVVLGEEPCSAMLYFADVPCITELYTMAWECTGVEDNNLLVAAPVRTCAMVLATVHGNITKITIERFFRKLGTFVSMDPRDDQSSYLVTFENASDAKSVSDKREHTVGGAKITTQLWHHCLSKKAYENFLNLPKADATGNAPTANVQQPDNVATKGKSTPTTWEETDTVLLKRHEYILLQRSDFISKLDKLPDIIVEPEEDMHAITLKGSEKKVKSTKLKVKEELLNFEEECFGASDDEVSDFLCQPRVVKIINDVLEKKEEVAYVYEKDGKLHCYKDCSLKLKNIKLLVERGLVVEREYLGEKMRALTSDKGRQFISDLHDKAKAPCKIQLDKGTEEVVITVYEGDPSEKQRIASIKYDLDSFVKDNQIVTTRVPFPGLHLEYAFQFLKLQTTVMVRLQATGAEVKVESGSITVSGLEAAVVAAEQEVHALGKDITVQEEVIQCFGIQEYLQSSHGQDILGNIGKKNSCLLKLGAYPAVVADGSSLGPGPSQRSPRPAPALKGTLIGSCSVDEVKVKFIMGDITSLDVNVIVNAVDFKRQCRKGMNKVIIDNGGDVIQQELNSYRGSTQTGTLIETQGGKMHCSSVYHLILKKDGEANDLLAFTRDILRKADQDGHKSLAMPLLGCGRFKLQKVGVSLNVAKAVKFHAGQASSLKEIIVCDYDPIHLKSIMERFDDIDQVMSLDSVSRNDSDGGSDDSDASRSPRQDKKDKDASGGKNTVTFGTINFTIKQGDILQESCDAIVCGIKDTMELKSGGAVSKNMFQMCGGALQTECSQKVDELSQEGAVVTSSNGLSCKSIIFVNMSKYSRNWYKGVERVLALAEEKGFASVALPALGTGSKRADMPTLKSSILSAVKKFGKGKPSKVKDIRLVIFDKRTLHIFQDDGVSDKRSRKKDSKSSLPVPIVSKSASVQVVYQNAASGNKAVKELRQECSSNFSKSSVTNAETTKLSDKEVKKLEVAGLHKHVQVNIQRESGTYTLSGFHSKAFMQVQDEICKALLALKDKEHQQDFRSFKTAFKWQFMTRDRWRDFEPEINIEIEKAFKKSEDSVQVMDPTGRKYRIDFKTMKEFRVRSNGEEEITTINRYDLSAAVANVPTTWDKMATGENVKIVQLSNSSKEYTDVETYFKNCGAGVTIKKIERIQNVVLYQQYSSKKTYFDKTNNPKGTENEKKLFHGTDPAAIANINECGFNRSFCGKNATMYGEGVYFAEESSYSVSYARQDANGNKMMYLARVLVGVSTPSNSGMKYLPNKPGTNVPFDSGRGPKMYIIFHDCQAYPEYLITF